MISGPLLVMSPLAEAATVTKYFELNGALQLWNWNTSGLTKLGDPVTPATLPYEMSDPARLSMYNAGHGLISVVRNYRPSEYTALNDWKGTTDFEVASFELAGTTSGLGDLPDWGETVVVIDILEPPAAQQGIGTNWVVQSVGGNIPSWWCEFQADAIDKDLNGAFEGLVGYTFDDAAILPDGTVQLWIMSLVTDDLAGVQGGSAGYGILEGAMRLTALTDDDGDGYFAERWDCDDDASDDLPICATCACGEEDCAPCARCINPAGTGGTDGQVV